MKRITELPLGGDILVPNSPTGCLSKPTASPADIAGGAGNGHDGSHTPLVPSALEDLPRLGQKGAPPFLRGYFAGDRAAGVYTPGGYSWATMLQDGDGPETRRLVHAQ